MTIKKKLKYVNLTSKGRKKLEAKSWIRAIFTFDIPGRPSVEEYPHNVRSLIIATANYFYVSEQRIGPRCKFRTIHHDIHLWLPNNDDYLNSMSLRNINKSYLLGI